MGKYYLGTGNQQINFQVVDSTGVINDLNLSGLYLSVTGKAADADKLDNYDSSFFRNAQNLTGIYTGQISGSIGNADTLDGLDSSYFLNGANITGTVSLSGTFTGYYTGAFSGTITHTDSITFHTGLGINPDPAELTWNDDVGTMQLGLQGGNIDLRVGLQNYEYVTNRNASTLSKGSVVYISGAQGNRPAVALALANADSTSAVTFGILAEDIASMANGYAITNGLLTNLNTTGFAEGAALYLSPTVSGAVISSKPQAPSHSVLVGFCVRSHASAGEILVKIQNGVELDELHDVRIISAQNNDIIRYNAPSGVWFNSNTLALNGTGSHYISGDLGIGTSSPSAKLHIFGADKRQIITSTTDNAALVLGQWDGATNRIESSTRKLLITSYASGISLGVNGSENVHVSTSGNLGVGTTSPQFKLDVNGTASIAQSYYLNKGFADGVEEYLIRGSAGSWNGFISYTPSSSTANRGFKFGAWDNGGNRNDWVSIWNGDVGIGITAPSQKLEVRGNIKLGGDNSGNYIYYVSNAENTIIRTTRTDVTQEGLMRSDGWGNFTFNKSIAVGYSLGSGPLTGNIYASGSVGIGTTNPTQKLYISGGNAAIEYVTGSVTYTPSALNTSPRLTLIGQYSTTDTYNLIRYWSGGSHDWSAGTVTQSSGAADYIFQSYNGSAHGERLRITAAGNVGIGTTSPTQKLYISTGGSNGGIVVDTGAGSTSAFIRLINSNQNWDVNTQTNNRFAIYDQTNSKQPFTIEPNTPSNTMWLAATGNVGIGITIPLAKLHLYSDDTNVMLSMDGSGAPYMRFLKSGTATGYIGTAGAFSYGGNTDLGIRADNSLYVTSLGGSQYFNAGAVANILVIASTGNVGIGTTSPSYKLHVNGNSFFEDILNIAVDKRIQTYPSSVGGYAMGLTLWSANTSGASEAYGRPGFIGRNLSWNGSNFIAASSNAGSNWGVVTGMMVTNTDVRFLTRAASENGLDYSLGTDLTSITRMVINTSGNVGIGTTSPTSLFTVQGSQSEIHVKHDATRAITIGNWDGTAQYIKSINLGVALTPFVLQASRFTFDTGNVGIGTTSPVANLHIYRGVNSTVATLGEVASYSTVKIGKFRADQDNSLYIGNAGSFCSFLQGANDAGSNAMHILINPFGGNVGIGTTSPSYKLHVVGDARIGANGQRIWLYDDGNAHVHATSGPLWLNAEDSSGIYINNQTNGSVYLTNGTGRVGIGTTSVSYNLEVAKASAGATFAVNADMSAAGEASIIAFTSKQYNTYYKAAIIAYDPHGGSWNRRGLAFCVNNTTDGTSASYASDKALYIAPDKSSTFYGNVTIGGDLIINGTTTTVNSTVTTIDDPIITLGGDTAPTVDDNKDRGVEFKWHNGSAAKVGFFGFDDSTGYFTFIPDATNSSEVFSGTQGDIQAANFRGTFVGSLSNALTAGSYLTGSPTSSYNGSVATTFNVDATSANTASKVVARDASGNFSAGVITGTRLEARNSGTTQIYIDSTNNGSKEIVFQNNGATTGYLWQASTYLGLGGGSGSNSLFVTTSNGNVGVGTTSPIAKLTVSKGVTNSISTADSSNTSHLTLAGSDSLVRLQLGVGGATYNYAGWIQASYDNTGGANGVEPLLLNPIGGNVGIGQISPTAKLEVESGASDTVGIRVRDSVNGVWTEIRRRSIECLGGDFWINSQSSFLDLRTANSSRLYISTTGDVGIGTISPSARLHTYLGTSSSTAAGNAIAIFEHSSNAVVQINGPDASSMGLFFGRSGAAYYSGIERSGTDLYIKNNSIAAITVLSSGNVGIGTTTPSAKLDVSGDSVQNVGLVRFTNSYASGNVYYPTASFIQTRGNHSYGIVSEFRTNTAADSDRPSILFYAAQAAHSWQVGQVTSGWGTSDNFGIGYRASNTPGSFSAWPTNYFTITTGGNVGIGVTGPSYKLDVAGAGGGNVGVRLTPDNGKVRFYGYDILGYNTQNIWMISNDPTNRFTLGTSWDWDSSCDLVYTPGTYGAVAGALLIGQINKNSATFTHGYTALYTNGAEKVRITKYGTLLVGDNIDFNGGSWWNNGNAVLGKNGTDKIVVGYLASNTLGAMIGAHNSAMTAWAAMNINGTSISFRIAEATKAILDAKGAFIQGGGTGRSTYGTTVVLNRATTFAANSDVGDGERFLSIVNENNTTNAMATLGFRINPNGGNANAMLDMKFVNTGATSTSKLHYSFNHGGSWTDRLTIQSDGNIGIGTTTPSAKLHVVQNNPTSVGSLPSNVGAILDNNSHNYLLFRNTADNNTYAGLLFQDNNVGAYIAFRNYAGSGTNDGTNGDALYYGTYTDHIFQAGSTDTVGARTEIFRIKQSGKTVFYAGVWHNSSDGYERFHFGSGDTTYFKAPNSTFVFRNSSDSAIMTLNTTGLGIGISPSTNLNVAGVGNKAGGNILMGDQTNNTAKWTYLCGTHYAASSQPQGIAIIGCYAGNGSNTVTIGGSIYEANPATSIEFWTHTASTHNLGGTRRMVIDSNGSVGINTTSPGEKLHVSGTVRIDGTTNGLRIFKDGGAAVTSTLYLANSGNTRAYNWQLNSSGDGLDFFTYDGNAWAYKITYLANGNVGIGTQAPSYKLEVNGSFAATTKSFVIPHPTKEGKKLRYGSLEGPENGVYVRGKTTSKVIELPDYWTKLVDPESITVQLTPIGSHQKLYVEKIEDNKVYIANENLLAKSINCFFYILAERADVEKLQVEIDA